MTRSVDDRYVAGVAGGIARSLGVEPFVVRATFVVSSVAYGLGLIVYLIAWWSSSDPADVGASRRGRRVTVERTVGFALVALGVLVLLRHLRLIGVPRDFYVGGPMFMGIIVTSFVCAVLFGPWLAQLYRQLRNERRGHIRSAERAEMSAHLHDSVLHTLALIQRSDAPPDVIALARRQERELRAWLLGRDMSGSSQLRDAVDALITRVEESYPIKVDSVVVGDCTVDERVQALVHATQEAVVNAARHASVETVSVYVEVEDSSVTAYVRDAGIGFDTASVAKDRRGIAESIDGRMRRAGGEASVRSAKGQGTEVEMRIEIEG